MNCDKNDNLDNLPNKKSSFRKNCILIAKKLFKCHTLVNFCIITSQYNRQRFRIKRKMILNKKYIKLNCQTNF